MIFEQEYIVFEILDVLYLEQKEAHLHHKNRNFDALTYRFEADTVIKTEKQTVSLSDDSVCYIPSDVAYTRISQKDRMIVVHFKPFNFHAEAISDFMPKQPQKYRVLFEQIMDIWNKKEPAYKSECAAILQQIFAQAYKEHMPKHKGSKIYESVQYLEKNCLKKDFSLPCAAKKSFVSEPYFRKLFKEEFGVSPKHYVIARRLRHATALILTRYYSLQEIADLCGYRDYKHFSSEFKKHIGVSPSAYFYNFGMENYLRKPTHYGIINVTPYPQQEDEHEKNNR